MGRPASTSRAIQASRARVPITRTGTTWRLVLGWRGIHKGTAEPPYARRTALHTILVVLPHWAAAQARLLSGSLQPYKVLLPVLGIPGAIIPAATRSRGYSTVKLHGFHSTLTFIPWPGSSWQSRRFNHGTLACSGRCPETFYFPQAT